MTLRNLLYFSLAVMLAGCNDQASFPTSVPLPTVTRLPTETATPSPPPTVTPTPTEHVDQNVFHLIGQNGELSERLADLQPFNIQLEVIPERAGDVYQACMQMEYLLQLANVVSKNRIRDHQSVPKNLRALDGWMNGVAQPSVAKGEAVPNMLGWKKHRYAEERQRPNYGELIPIEGNVDLSRCTITLRRPGRVSNLSPLPDMIAMKGYWIRVQTIVRDDGIQNIQIHLAPSNSIKNNAGFPYGNEQMTPDEVAVNYSDLIAIFIEDMRWYREDMPNGWKEWGSGQLALPGYPIEKPYIVFLDAVPTTSSIEVIDFLSVAPEYLRIR